MSAPESALIGVLTIATCACAGCSQDPERAGAGVTVVPIRLELVVEAPRTIVVQGPERGSRGLGAAERDLLAAALVAESLRARDWAAILHVLDRRAERAGVPVDKMARRYCAAWRSSRARARRMRRLARDPAYRERHPLYGQWQRARKLVDRWDRGALPDPCRGKAWHWGGPMDEPKGRMIELDCGTTSNRFYGLR